MATGWRLVCTGVLLGLTTVGVARADVTGSYDGQLAGPKVPTTLRAAAAMTQNGRFLTGRIGLDGAVTSYGGAYKVTGTATPKRVKLKGLNQAGFKLMWTGKIVGEVVQGKGKVKGPGTKLNGTLVLTRNAVPAADGSACDTVYTANQTLFTTQVLGQAVSKCLACHVAGGEASAARLRLTTSDPLATARSIALQVDSANPSASRILEKPLGLLPHGGGIDGALDATSTEAQTLTNWVNLVAAAHCN
jgi:hypothetical protein